MQLYMLIVLIMNFANDELQYGGSPVRVGDEEYTLFRDHE